MFLNVGQTPPRGTGFAMDCLRAPGWGRTGAVLPRQSLCMSLSPGWALPRHSGWGVASPSPKMTWLIASLQRCSSSPHKGGCLGLRSLQLLDIFWGPPQTSGNVRDGRGFFFLFTGEALGRGGTMLRSYTALVVKVEARASCLRELSPLDPSLALECRVHQRWPPPLL